MCVFVYSFMFYCVCVCVLAVMGQAAWNKHDDGDDDWVVGYLV